MGVVLAWGVTGNPSWAATGAGRLEQASERAGRVAVGPLRVLGVSFLLTMMVCQVVSGLDARPERFTGSIVVLMAACALAFAAGSWGSVRALAAFGGAVLTGFAFEAAGVL